MGHLKVEEAFNDDTNQLLMETDVSQNPFPADGDSFLVAVPEALEAAESKSSKTCY